MTTFSVRLVVADSSLAIVGALAVIAHLLRPLPALSGELHQAAHNRDLAAVSALLEGGANINETDGEGETALHKAVRTNHAEVITMLLKARADPLISGRGAFGSTGTPLHLAAKYGLLNSLRVLLDAGIDPNLPDEGVGPPLHLAVFYRRTEAIDLLRSYGAVPAVATPIRSLIAAAEPKDGELIAGTCKICHHLEAAPQQRRLLGPTLWDIVGRPKASIPEFAYSDALKTAGGTWSYDDLNSFLADPRGYLPGTKMTGVFGIRAPERRASLIRYLRDLAAAPAPLPD